MMIKCSECGKKFSDNASVCPHCGCPISKQVPFPPKTPMSRDRRNKIIAAIIGVVIIGGIVLFCFVQQKIAEKNAKEITDRVLYGNGGTLIASVAREFENWTNNH